MYEPLPFPELTVSLASLYDTRPAIDLLIDKVQVIFNTAQKEYKSGDFDKARADYDRAVALMLASGYQVDSDPRLWIFSIRLARRCIPMTSTRSRTARKRNGNQHAGTD